MHLQFEENGVWVPTNIWTNGNFIALAKLRTLFIIEMASRSKNFMIKWKASLQEK